MYPRRFTASSFSSTLAVSAWAEKKLPVISDPDKHHGTCVLLQLPVVYDFIYGKTLVKVNLDQELQLVRTPFRISWWRQMETFSALLALCAGNSPITGEFPSQRSVTRSFDVFFDLRLNKQLNKQTRRRRFETTSRSSWCHNSVKCWAMRVYGEYWGWRCLALAKEDSTVLRWEYFSETLFSCSLHCLIRLFMCIDQAWVKSITN